MPTRSAVFFLPDENTYWKLWRLDGDQQARDVLIRHYLAYARALAAQIYRGRSYNEFEFDEYFQFATVGLMESVNRFDLAHGVVFKTFATRRIIGAIYSGLGALSERQQQASLSKRIAGERLNSLNPDSLSLDHPERLLRELADVGIGLALGFMLEGSGMVSIDEAALPDNAYAKIELRQLKQQVSGLIARLTEREQDVVRLHYFQGINFEGVARELGLTKGRISQLHRQALARLRLSAREITRLDLRA